MKNAAASSQRSPDSHAMAVASKEQPRMHLSKNEINAKIGSNSNDGTQVHNMYSAKCNPFATPIHQIHITTK